MKFYILCCLIFFVGFLHGYVCAGRVYFNKFLDLLKLIHSNIMDRIDRTIIGNDGSYSHTRIINLTWGLGGFWLICLCVLREIKIPGEILILMGGAMGISSIQAVANKINELKFASSQSSSQNTPVADGVKDDKSN